MYAPIRYAHLNILTRFTKWLYLFAIGGEKGYQGRKTIAAHMTAGLYLLVFVAAPNQYGLRRHHQSNLPRPGWRHMGLHSPVQVQYIFHPFLIPMCEASPYRGSRPAFIPVSHVFCWPTDRQCHVRCRVGRRWSLLFSTSRRLAGEPNRHTNKTGVAPQFHRWHTIFAPSVLNKNGLKNHQEHRFILLSVLVS